MPNRTHNLAGDGEVRIFTTPNDVRCVWCDAALPRGRDVFCYASGYGPFCTLECVDEREEDRKA